MGISKLSPDTAFGLGATDTRISTIDADGVALAAIKALIEQNQALTHRVKDLEKQNQRIEELVVRMVTEHVEQIVLNITIGAAALKYCWQVKNIKFK